MTASGSAFDIDIALRNSGGDRELLAELVRLFLEDTPGRVNDMKCAIERCDGAVLTRAAHTLKGSSSVFGASPVAELAARIEQFGRIDNMIDAALAFAELQKELEVLTQELSVVRTKALVGDATKKAEAGPGEDPDCG